MKLSEVVNDLEIKLMHKNLELLSTAEALQKVENDKVKLKEQLSDLIEMSRQRRSGNLFSSFLITKQTNN